MTHIYIIESFLHIKKSVILKQRGQASPGLLHRPWEIYCISRVKYNFFDSVAAMKRSKSLHAQFEVKIVSYRAGLFVGSVNDNVCPCVKLGKGWNRLVFVKYVDIQSLFKKKGLGNEPERKFALLPAAAAPILCVSLYISLFSLRYVCSPLGV